MANMREIRTRMKSIQDTMKITNAMYLISSSKLKQARKKLDNTMPYFNALTSTIADIMSLLPYDASYKYIEDGSNLIPEEKKRRLYIVMTADKGLAGAYNHNVLKMTEENLKKGENNVIFMIGQMGRNYFNRKNIVIDCEFLYVAQNPTLLRSRAVAESALDLFDSNEIDEVYIVFNKMINSMSCECETLKILPLERSAFEKKQGEYVHQATFSPSPKAVLQNLVPNYVKGIIYCALVEAFSSEQNSRMTAMESATNNAKDMLRYLSLIYNRARQAAITQEITEIVSGANSLSANSN